MSAVWKKSFYHRKGDNKWVRNFDRLVVRNPAPFFRQRASRPVRQEMYRELISRRKVRARVR